MKSDIRTITGCGAKAAAIIATPSATRCTKNARGEGYAATASSTCDRNGCSSDAGSEARSSSAFGWMPIWRLMMNSSRASPTPAFGSRENANAWSGVPTFIMIPTGISGIDPATVSSTVKSSRPSYT